MSRPHSKPYTADGIRRVKCSCCNQPAAHQWQCCADNGRWHPVCSKHDVVLNGVVMGWLNVPGREAKLKRYRERLQIA